MKRPVDFVVFVTGQACTLKCKDCGNFSPYAQSKRYALQDMLGDIGTFLSCVGRVQTLQIQGGEPFIYSDLAAVVGFVRRHENVNEIVVATNGTVLPNDETLHALQEHSVFVRISNYVASVDQRVLSSLILLLNENGIRHSMYQFTCDDGTWFNLGGREQPRDQDCVRAAARFTHCPFRGCLTLEDGRLGRCSRATISYKIQGYDPEPGDYVMVREIADQAVLRTAIESYLAYPAFMTACLFCNGGFGERIPPAVQLTAADE